MSVQKSLSLAQARNKGGNKAITPERFKSIFESAKNIQMLGETTSCNRFATRIYQLVAALLYPYFSSLTIQPNPSLAKR